MKVIRAQKAGFCFGVALALRKLDTLVANNFGRRVATFGEIIHNPQVLREYAALGVDCLDDASQAKADMAVLIRAHGVPQSVEEELRRRCAMVQDATCPKVKNAQLAISEATQTGAELFLYGEAEHPEVRGLLSYAHGKSRIFSSLEELQSMNMDESMQSIVLAAQTTQDRLQFESMRHYLQNKCGRRLTVLNTICYATHQRQEEACMLASRTDAVVVVGGRTSGNTRRLAELVRMRGVPVLLVESADELDPAFFQQVNTVGLTAGASTPGKIIDAVEHRLSLL